jgi:hypothetical protein
MELRGIALYLMTVRSLFYLIYDWDTATCHFQGRTQTEDV